MTNNGDIYISVIGASDCDEAVASVAHQVGAEVAGSGCVLVSGGLTGVMEASCRGAREAGGKVLAIVPGSMRSEANGYADYVVASGIGHARNLAVVATGDAIVAVGGKWGTLSEIGLARSLERQVVLVNSWSLDHEDFDVEGLHVASNAAEAVQLALTFANKPA